MGYRICYVAAEIEPPAIAKALDLEITETTHEIPDQKWWVARLASSGWSLLWAWETDFGERSRDLVAALSRQTGVFHCEVCETTMWSSAAYWSNGESVWRITHDGGDKGVFDLTAEGDLPPEFEAIRDKYFADQKNEDSEDVLPCDNVFEVPLEVVNASIDFRHHNVWDLDGATEFHVLDPPARPGFWSRLVGQR